MLTNRTKHTKSPVALGSMIWYCDTANIEVRAGYLVQAVELPSGWRYHVRSSDGALVRVMDRNIYHNEQDAEHHLRKHIESRLKYDLEHAKKLQKWLQEQED